MTKEQRPIYPLPHIVREGAWDIQSCPGVPGMPRTSNVAHEMLVPLGDNPLDQAIRAHEMGHAAWSPDSADGDEHGVSDESLAAAEEARVNWLVTKSGVSLEALTIPDIDRGMAAFAALSGNGRNIAQLVVATLNTGSAQLVQETIARYAPNESWRVSYAQSVAAAVFEEGTGFGNSVRLAKWLDDQNQQDPPTAACGQSFKDVGAEEMRAFSERSITRRNEWGILEHRSVPLSRSMGGRWPRRRLARDEGAIPRAIHRLTVDGRVFDQRVKKPGGTVLVDASGSMDLESSDILAILDAAPGATVAFYDGSADYDNAVGELVVVARNGATAAETDLQPRWSGNVVDGPALEWLIQQEEPRLWVCDGGVTGKKDATAPNLTEDAIRIATSGRVRRIPDALGAAEWLKKHVRKLHR